MRPLQRSAAKAEGGMQFFSGSSQPASSDAASSVEAAVKQISGVTLLLVSMLVISSAAFVVGSVNALTMAIVLVCSAISTIAGFAFSALAGALLFHLHSDPVYVVGILLISSTARAIYTVWAIRRSINWGELLPYFLGGAVGIPPGLYLLLYTRPELYLLSFGGFLICYAAYALAVPQPSIKGGRRVLDVLVGVLGGITGALAAFPGAFLVIWCGARGMEKHRQLALVQPFILIMQLATLAALALVQPSRITFAVPLSQFVVPAVVGAYIGLALYERLTARQLGTFINGLLLVSGIVLVSRSF